MKHNILTTVVVLLSIPLLFIKCTKTPDEVLPEEPVLIDLTSNQISLIESENSFAFDIFRKVVEDSEESENLIISPLSISYALSMTLNGADGATRDSMLKALRVTGMTPEEINSAFQQLTEALLSVDKRVLMTIANSVWTKEGFPVKEAFIDILETYYDAESIQFDINDPATPDIINQWIEDNTNGLIKDMIDELEPDVVMLLINAIYFKGIWKYQFEEGDTDYKTFYKTGDETIEVPMMNQEVDLMLYRGENFALAELPYGQGNFVMDIILPDDQDGINRIIPAITESSFNSWISQATETKVNIYLPRFKYDYKKKLKDILSDMGMRIAFWPGADFTNIADTDLNIQDVIHQAFIETNEEGTEAAAATVVIIELSSMPSEPLVFNTDHPFIYIIRETTTNSIIFMGCVNDPLAE